MSNKILILVIFFFSFHLLAEKNVINKIELSDAPLWKIRDSIRNYLKTFDTSPKGWKQLERGAAFWERHLDENQKMTSPKYIYNEAKTFLDKHKKKESNYFLEDKKWELLGPEISLMNYGNGKVNCIYQLPGNDSILFLGSASGGMWRSNDAGKNWKIIPMTDFISNGIMDIAISPSNTNIMYATSGDPYGTSLFKSYSLGVMKSIDGGNSWNLLTETLDFSDSISFYEILVHPENPDIVIVSTNKYILKSIDGGNSWNETLAGYYFRDMKFMPNNPDVIYATTMMPWNKGGAKIYISKDCGESWNELIEFKNARRIELATTLQNPNSLYVLTGHYSTYKGMEGLYKFGLYEELIIDTLLPSKDTSVTGTNYVYSQSFHNLAIGISPVDSNVIIIAGVNCGMTTDGGKIWNRIPTMHVDHHDIKFIDTLVYFCQDGGVHTIGYNELLTAKSIAKIVLYSAGLAITQYYRLGANKYTSELLLCGSQDNGTHLFNNGNWSHVDNGDGMECQFSPFVPEQKITSHQREIINADSIDKTELFPWISTYKYTPFSKDTFLVVGENLYAVTDTGEIGDKYNIKKISNFPLKQTSYDMRALAICNTDKNYLYFSVGEYLYMTNDYGTNWKKVDTTIAPISYIYVSDKDPNLFWYSCQGNVKNEKVFEYNDGEIKNINYNLPNIAVNCVIQNPKDSSLFIGTDMGIFILKNGSNEWELFNHNEMPYTSVMELEYTKGTGYLYAATWGRGIWRFKLDECNTTKPTINFQNDTAICETDFPIKMYITNKENGSTYIWSNGETGDTLNISQSGTYFLCKEDINTGCTEISNQINITKKYVINEGLVQLQTRNPACIGDTVIYEITENIKLYTTAPFKWSNGSTDSLVKITEPTELYLIFDTTNIDANKHNFCGDIFFIDSVKFVEPPVIPTIIQVGSVLNCEDYADSYEWFINDSSLGIDNRRYLFVEKPGKYELVIRNENYCTAKSKQIIINVPTDINSIISGNIYPTPSSNLVAMELFYSGNDTANISFYDENGGLIEDGGNIRINRYFYTKLDFTEHPSGIYYIVIKIKDYNKTFRVIINK